MKNKNVCLCLVNFVLYRPRLQTFIFNGGVRPIYTIQIPRHGVSIRKWQNFISLSNTFHIENSYNRMIDEKNEKNHERASLPVSCMSSRNPSEEGKELVNIGEGSWEEVYKGVLTTQFKLLKMFSIGSSVLGLSLQPLLYENLCNSSLALVLAFGTFVGFFTFVSPCLIHVISKKYVTKLEYHAEEDLYAATTLTFFLKEKKVQFSIDDVTYPKFQGVFTSFMVKNNALFVDPSQFDDLDHYSRLMGYDKPIDFTPEGWYKR